MLGGTDDSTLLHLDSEQFLKLLGVVVAENDHGRRAGELSCFVVGEISAPTCGHFPLTSGYLIHVTVSAFPRQGHVIHLQFELS